ncbi:hypothetical protein NJT12_20795 [Flavobacterium sp. AC]|uniref:DUF3899 domain-containing protein n=1 Tax=Flavobacterium azizsancarii TaxID=2961580 RepID=A0ABT4WHK8_9FLAO|nr:hypothetical protein [Flavobacterium azizsancarii]MDA6072068.1 hypothetical protein [Flavobacterium azizsancarii]
MEKIKERKKQAYDNMFYSTQRIDLLVISLSGAGIYVCLETIKHFVGKAQPCGLLIKISGFIFVVAITLNFLSQHFGYKANESDYLMCDADLDLKDPGCDENKREDFQLEFDRYDQLAEKYSSLTKVLNASSMIALIVGLLSILAFFAITF